MKLVHAICSALLGAALVGCDFTEPPESEPPAASSSSAPVFNSRGTRSDTVRASGSSALQPLVNAAKEKFEAQYPWVSVEVSAGGSKKGIADVASGAVQIGNSDIPAPADLRGQLVDHKVAVVAFAAMANKGAFNDEVTALTLEQMAKVFRGQIKDWSELGGKPQQITVINRAPSSGTRAAFGKIVLGGDDFVESQTEDNSGALVTKLKQSPGAISYLGTSFQDPELLTIAIKTTEGPVAPTPEAITAGKYPIWAYEHMYTRGEPIEATKAFIDFVMSPEFQRESLPKVKGFISIVAMKVTRESE